MSRRIINASKSLHPKADRLPGVAEARDQRSQPSGVAEVTTFGRKHRNLPQRALSLSTVENQKIPSVVSSFVILAAVRLRSFLALL